MTVIVKVFPVIVPVPLPLLVELENVMTPLEIIIVFPVVLVLHVVQESVILLYVPLGIVDALLVVMLAPEVRREGTL